MAWFNFGEALSKNPRLKGKRVTVIDGHSHTVESTTYGDNVTYNQTGSYLHNVGKSPTNHVSFWAIQLRFRLLMLKNYQPIQQLKN